MKPDLPPSTAPSSSTTALGRSLLAAPVMRPWPPSIEEARGILSSQPYEVLERIGHGGMGAVFKVHNLEPGMGRIEAVKIRRPEARDDDLFRERFLREIGTLARLRHPGITTIYRSGDSDEGYLWFSMEYIEGQTLAELLEAGMPALPPERVIDITRQLCITLQFIHKEGRLHRDLKPANVMVSEDGSVRLLDFGIARSSDPADLAAVSLLTGQGDNPHTPDYAAPEQMHGGSIDQRTDLYGLGRIITEMIRPAGSPDAGPSANYPQRLYDLVDDLLAFDQQDRPGSAADVIEKLGQIEPGDPGFWGKDRCPFRGLEAYQPEHAEIFFGREAAIRRGMDILLGHSQITWKGFLLIIGASGSGKSSLARAGLAPALLRHGMPHGGQAADRCPVIFDLSTIRHDDECLLPPLARCLEAITGTVSKILTEALRHPSSNLAPLLGIPGGDRPGVRPGVRLCLILDQFEHLFRASLPHQAHGRFLNAVSRLSRTPGVVVLVTLRSDFYQHCGGHPVLMELKEDHQMDLAAPQPWELAAMLRLAARASGLGFEALPDGRGLDDVLLEQARRNPQTLPLLSYMLNELWERRDRDKGMLLVQAYQDLGGFEGAVAAKATETFDRFSEDYPENPESSLDRMLRLVVETSDSQTTTVFVRRLASNRELAEADPDELRLAERFVAARLFVTIGQGGVPNHGLTIAHECLLRVWPRAVAWTEHNRDFLLTRSRIALRMKEGSPLLAGDPLLEAAKMHLALQSDAFSLGQAEFVIKSMEAVEYHNRKVKRRRMTAFAGLSLLTAMATFGAFVAWKLKKVADNQTSMAKDQREEVVRERNHQNALLWKASRADREAATRALELDSVNESLLYLGRSLDYRRMNYSSLIATLQLASKYDTYLHIPTINKADLIIDYYVSPENQDAFKLHGLEVRYTNNNDNTGKHSFYEKNVHFLYKKDDYFKFLFDLSTTSKGPKYRYFSLSPDHKHVIAYSNPMSDHHDQTSNSYAFYADIISLKLKEIAFQLITGSQPYSTTYSKCGGYITTWLQDYSVLTTEIKTGKTISQIHLGQKAVEADITPDGRYGVVKLTDKTIVLVDYFAGRVIGRLLNTSKSGSTYFCANGRYLIIEQPGARTRVVDPLNGSDITLPEYAAAISLNESDEDTHWIIGRQEHKKALLNHFKTGIQIYEHEFVTPINTLQYSNDGKYLAAVLPDGLRLIKTDTDKTIKTTVTFSHASCPAYMYYPGMFFSPDNNYLAIGSFNSDNQVKIVNMDSGEHFEIAGEDTSYAQTLSFSHDSELLAAGFVGNEVALYNIKQNRRLWSSTSSALPGDYENDCLTLVDPSITGYIYNKATNTAKNSKPGVVSTKICPLKKNIAVLRHNGRTLELYDVISGNLLWRTNSRTDWFWDIKFTVNGAYVLAIDVKNTLSVLDTGTGRLVFNHDFGKNANYVVFKPNDDFIGVHFSDQSKKLYKLNFFNLEEDAIDPWLSFISQKSGLRFTEEGIIIKLSNKELEKIRQSCEDFIREAPDPDTRHQHAVMKWLMTPVEIRSTTPWTNEPTRIAFGRLMMNGFISPSDKIAELARQAPWHPLEPVSAARIQNIISINESAKTYKMIVIKSTDRTTNNYTPDYFSGSDLPFNPDKLHLQFDVPKPSRMNKAEPILSENNIDDFKYWLNLRQKFLARATINSLHAVDDSIYGSESLADYALWSAKIMSEELYLIPEAIEAVDIAIAHLGHADEKIKEPLLKFKKQLIDEMIDSE